MDQYRLIISDGKSRFDVSAIIKEPTWGNSMDTLGSQLAFSVPNHSADPELNKIRIRPGHQFAFLNKKSEILKGMVVDEQEGYEAISFTCFDFGFYLNKSETIIQFKKVAVSTAILQLCKKMNIPVDSICNMPTLVTKIYSGTAADILKDLISLYEKETGKKTRMEMLRGKLRVFHWGDILIKATYQPPWGDPLNPLLAIGKDYRINRSMADMINSVVVASEISGESTGTPKKGAKPQTVSIYTKVEDPLSIKNYGLLQDVMVIDQKDMAKAKQLGKVRLAEGNRVTEEVTINILGDDALLSGRLLDLSKSSLGLRGKHLIRSVSHSYANGIHKCALTLGKVV